MRHRRGRGATRDEQRARYMLTEAGHAVLDSLPPIREHPFCPDQMGLCTTCVRDLASGNHIHA